jgi:hypothetical protein
MWGLSFRPRNAAEATELNQGVATARLLRWPALCRPSVLVAGTGSFYTCRIVSRARCAANEIVPLRLRPHKRFRQMEKRVQLEPKASDANNTYSTPQTRSIRVTTRALLFRVSG